MGVDCEWARETKERKKKWLRRCMSPGPEKTKQNKKTKKPRRQVSPGPIPSSLIVSPPPCLLWCGRLCGGPRCRWCWCHVPPLFPHHSLFSHPLTVHFLLIPVIVILGVIGGDVPPLSPCCSSSSHLHHCHLPIVHCLLSHLRRCHCCCRRQKIHHPVSSGLWQYVLLVVMSPVIPSPFIIFLSPSLLSPHCPCCPPPLTVLLLLSSAVLVSS